MRRTIFVIVTIGLLLTAITASAQVLQVPPVTAGDITDDVGIDTNLEYSNGSISSQNPDLPLWYDWVNASGTQIIFLAYHSYVVNPPITTFLGQHYYTENNTEVFVGNTLTSMEIYNDTNGNGLPDADYVSGKSEILYHFDVNSSVSFEIMPIEKTLKDGLPHYTWGIRYRTIDGFLTIDGYTPVARVIVDFMDFSYDFYVQNNASYLKTNFGIGKILETTPSYSVPNALVSLDGLSVALFYGTCVIANKPYVTLVNGNPYNSTTAPASVQPTDLGEIKIENAKAYDFVFGEDYTLSRDSGQESHKSKSTAVSNQSVSSDLQRYAWVFSNLGAAVSSLFPKISSMKAAINLDYNVSSFLYRICYPVWDGCELQHDPTYIAYLNATIVPEIGPPLMFVTIASLVSVVVLTAALIDLKKTRKMLGYTAKIPQTTIR
jgi:hypothetical protein